MSIQWSPKALKALAPWDTRYEVSIDGAKGLRVRVQTTGQLSVYYIYLRPGSKNKNYLYLGQWQPATGQAGLDVLMLEYIGAKAMRDRGGDPAAARANRKKATEAAVVNAMAPVYSFGRLVEDFLAAQKSHGKVAAHEWERIFMKDVLPEKELCRKEAAAVTRGDLVSILDKVKKRTRVGCNRLQSALTACLNWGAGVNKKAPINPNPMLQGNPIAGLPRHGGEEVASDRALNDDEIRVLWNAIDAEGMNPVHAAGLKLMIVTGQRVGEVTKMKWSEVNLRCRVWSMPASKNKKPHKLPLSRLARELLLSLPRDDERVFPVAEKTLSQQMGKLRKRHEFRDVPHFKARDFRRTCATGMRAVGVPNETVGRVLNHTREGITKPNARRDYQQEKADALERWSDHLIRLLDIELEHIGKEAV